MQKMMNRKKVFAGGLVLYAALFTGLSAASGADGLILQRLSGVLEYQSAGTQDRQPIVGQLLVQPRGYAVTKARSMAAIDLPDSSVVSIGASSHVELRRFEREAWGSSSSMTIVDGAIHFAVKHPMGARANYVFVTPTAQIAVRGTEGVIVARADETIVACVHGTNNDTEVYYGGRHMFIPVGMTVRIRRGLGKVSTMSMRRGISGPEFSQFNAIIARNHTLRMQGKPR